MKKFMDEFKAFIMRGNVIDLAVGVIIGAAFQAIVDSLVNDIVMPLIGLICGGSNFNNWVLKLFDAEINIGSFVSAVLNFLIMAFVIFCVVKAINTLSARVMRKDEAPAEPTTKNCPFCMSEIDIKATRCPHCTSQLVIPAEEVEAAAEAEAKAEAPAEA